MYATWLGFGSIHAGWHEIASHTAGLLRQNEVAVVMDQQRIYRQAIHLPDIGHSPSLLNPPRLA